MVTLKAKQLLGKTDKMQVLFTASADELFFNF